MSVLLPLAALLLAPQVKDVQKGRWNIDLSFPRFAYTGPVSRLANAEGARRENALASAFRRDFLKDHDGPISEDYTWQLNSEPHRAADMNTLASGWVRIGEYRGGAHGSASFATVNVGLVGGKAKTMRLQDFFRSGVDGLAQANRAVRASMKREGYDAPPYFRNGRWKSLDKAQRERFAIASDGFYFFFDPEELSAGGGGEKIVKVPFAKLPGLDRRGVLKNWL